MIKHADLNQVLFAGNVFYACTSPTIKLSILLLYRRIFVTPVVKSITFVVGCILAAWLVAVVFTQIFSCTPVEGSWKPTTARHCIDSIIFYEAVAISNVLLDFMLLLLPIPVVWKLNMSMRRKAQVCGIFLVGAL